MAVIFIRYVESGVRRISLAEQLRKIPLSFFGKKDLSDLTSTIMADCATLETASSHWIPELVGACISTALFVSGAQMILKFGIANEWMKSYPTTSRPEQISLQTRALRTTTEKPYCRRDIFFRPIKKNNNNYKYPLKRAIIPISIRIKDFT